MGEIRCGIRWNVNMAEPLASDSKDEKHINVSLRNGSKAGNVRSKSKTGLFKSLFLI